jgi:hypothetical protein
MPDPETDISAESRDYIPDLEGPADDDAEAMYDPDGIEVSRGRELGLGVGARDLELQRDAEGGGAASLEGDVERVDGDELTAADSLIGDDASDLGIDEEFDTEDAGTEAERQDDRATFRGIPESDYRRG